MLNEQINEQHIRKLLKHYVEAAPLSYWLMSKIKYEANTKQINDLNDIYYNVKDILIKDRESPKTKEAFLTIFINYYRLHKMSISYGKETLNNNLIISSNNNAYVNKNTTIPNVVRLLCQHGYIKKEIYGRSFDNNKVTSRYSIDVGMKKLIDLYVANKKSSDEINFIDLSAGDSNIRLKVKDDNGKKVIAYNWKWNTNLRKWNSDLEKINKKLSECEISISDIEAFKEIYNEKNYEIALKQLETERRYWNKVEQEYRSKKPKSKISNEKICEIKVNESPDSKKYWKKWVSAYKDKHEECILSDKAKFDIVLKKNIKSKKWRDIVKEYRKENNTSDLSNEDICRLKINNEIEEFNKEKHYVLPWKKINPYVECIEEKKERICSMGNLYMSFPNTNVKKLYRTFINDFEQGGRHYHIWVQNIPEKCQQYILIENEPTINIDICSCHFLLLAAELGFNLKKGEKYYDIGLEELKMHIARKNPFEGIITDKKDIKKKIKKVVNTLLNADCKKSFIKSCKDNGINECDALMIKDKIVEKYWYLNDYICTGEGVYLQKKESDYIHNVLYECFIKNNISLIPMCDGVLCKISEVNKVEEIMFKVWKKSYDVDLLLERK